MLQENKALDSSRRGGLAEPATCPARSINIEVPIQQRRQRQNSVSVPHSHHPLRASYPTAATERTTASVEHTLRVAASERELQGSSAGTAGRPAASLAAAKRRSSRPSGEMSSSPQWKLGATFAPISRDVPPSVSVAGWAADKDMERSVKRSAVQGVKHGAPASAGEDRWSGNSLTRVIESL